MMESWVGLRNFISGFIYSNLFKRIFFMMDPEAVHDNITSCGVFLGKFQFTRELVKLLFYYSNKKLEQNISGIHFPNPVGLAAGFDKDAQLVDILPAVGFGFAEVGSVTGEPCGGNPKPRLWRLKKSRALVVNYGLKNKGCEEVSKRLGTKKFQIPIGTSIAKTNSRETVDTQAGISDYKKAFGQFINIGAYFTINISCPNTYGGQPFTDAKKLDLLLTEIDKIKTNKPIFLKISPDLSKTEIDGIIGVSLKHQVRGFICSNLTKFRHSPGILDQVVPKAGGISGKVVEDLANGLISYVYKKTKGKYIIIGCGGVFSTEDAYKKIKLGVSLVQLITGMVFEGPQLIGGINSGLAGLLKRDGFENISEAVGVEN